MGTEVKKSEPRVVRREPAHGLDNDKVEEAKKVFEGKGASGDVRGGFAPKPAAAAPPRAVGKLDGLAPSEPSKAKIDLSGERPRKAAGWARQRPNIREPSPIFSILGPERFAPVRAVRVPNAKIAWVNFELARELGFNVPANNRMTPELEKELLDALGYRALKKDEDPAGREVIEMRADRYGGSGLGGIRAEDGTVKDGAQGSGRAAFFPYGNLLMKGIGLTPLVAKATDFGHSHGNASLYESLLEAGAGELSTNLLSHGARRALAIVDMGEDTVYPDGGRERAAGLVLAGPQLRPAHAVDGWYRGGSFSVPAFVRMTAATGDLVTRFDSATRQQVPDLKATMLRVLDKQAQTSAEQMRFRLLHGAPSTSNMGLEGSILDFGTLTTQDRTAPIKVLDHAYEFGKEHQRRGVELGRVFDAMVASLTSAERKRYNAAGPLGAEEVMDGRYQFHLQRMMLQATGLKPELASALQQEKPNVGRALAEAASALMALRNPGEINVDKGSARDISVVDVFGMLQRMPATYFGEAFKKADKAARLALVKELLAPRIQGEGDEAEKMSRQVDRLAARLVDAYGQTMVAAEKMAGGFYDSPLQFRRAVQERAGFENQAIPAFARENYRQSLREAVDKYLASGDRDIFREAVDKTVARSVRSVERLLTSGATGRLPEGGLELERRTIDGVDYSVRGWDDAVQKRRLHVSLPARAAGDSLTLAVAGAPRLTLEQAKGLRYRFTTDGWKTFSEAPARVATDPDGSARIDFDIPALTSSAGRLEGAFYGASDGGFWIKDGTSDFRGYTYAIPDGHDLRRLGGARNGG